MKKYIPLSFALGSFLFAANIFADQIKFASDVVSSNIAGGTAPTATLSSTTGGAPIATVVILPKTLAIKDLKTGDIFYLPAPKNTVYKVITVTPGPDGSLLVDVEDTFLSLQPKLTKGTTSTTTTTTTVPSTSSTMPSMPSMTTPSTSTTTTPTSPSMTMPSTSAPAKTGGY